LRADGIVYVNRVAAGEPFNGIISGHLPLIWAHAQVVCESPDKKKVEDGGMVAWWHGGMVVWWYGGMVGQADTGE
jgi:hypothetical protein